jgi:hypothetical protein
MSLGAVGRSEEAEPMNVFTPVEPPYWLQPNRKRVAAPNTSAPQSQLAAVAN